MSALSKKEEEKNEMVIRALMKLPENRKCINCASVGPQSLCMTFSTFICTPCSGVHREFSHRIKSISMSKFTKEDAAALEDGGNQKAREVYLRAFDLAGMALPDNLNVRKLRDFIRAVYVEQRYTGEKPLPPLEVSQEPSPRSSIESHSRGRFLGFGRADSANSSRASDRNERSSSLRVSQDRYSVNSLRDSQEVPRGIRDSQDQSRGVRDSQDRSRGVRDSQDQSRGVRDSQDRSRGVRDSQDRGRAEQSVRDSQEGSSGGVEKERKSRGGFGSSLFTNMDRDRRAKAEAKEAERARRQATMTAPRGDRGDRGDMSGQDSRSSQELPSDRSKAGTEAVERPRRRVEDDTPPARPLSDVLGPDVHVTFKGKASVNGGPLDDSASQGSVNRDSSQASVPPPRVLFPPGKDSMAADTPDSKSSEGKTPLTTDQLFSLIDFSSESPSEPIPQDPSTSLGVDPFGLQDSLGGPPPQAAPPQPPSQPTSSAPAWSAFEEGAPPLPWGPPPPHPQPPAGPQLSWGAENQYLGQPGMTQWQPLPHQAPPQQPYPIPPQPLPHLSYIPPPQQPSYMQPPNQQPYQPPPPPLPWGQLGASVPMPPFPPNGAGPPPPGPTQGGPPSAGPPPVTPDPAALLQPPMPAVVQPKVVSGPRKEIPQDLFSFSDPYAAPDSMKYPQVGNQQQPQPGGEYGAPNPPIPGQPNPYAMPYTPLVTDQPGAMPSYAQPPKSSNPFDDDEDDEPSAAADQPPAMVAYPPTQAADQVYASQPTWSGPATYPGGFPTGPRPPGPGYYPPNQHPPPFAPYPPPQHPYDDHTYSRPYPGPASTGSYMPNPGASPLDMASSGPASTGGYHPGYPLDGYGGSQETVPKAESGPVDPFANLGLDFGSALPSHAKAVTPHPTAESSATNTFGL